MQAGDGVVEIMDLNKNGKVDRCEDAQFQYIFGESREYAMKFSGTFTKESLLKVCGKRFPFV
jgi:hypothetical protein